MAELSNLPLYNEEDATRWLAWLAYQMRERDLTVFEIEGLQPDWLTGWREIATHILFTRTFWGIISGLIIGLTVQNFIALNQVVTMSLVISLISGLSEVIIPIHKFDTRLHDLNNTSSNNFITTSGYMLIATLIAVLIFVLGIQMDIRPNTFLDAILISSISGLIVEIIRTSRVTVRKVSNYIRTTVRKISNYIRTMESLRWFWQQVRENSSIVLIAVLAYIYSMTPNLITALVIFLIISMLGVLISGFLLGQSYMKTWPSRSLWRIVQWTQSHSYNQIDFTTILATLGWILSQLDVIEHGIIRLIISSENHAPPDYAHFLDYAANELNFLQKVGGGYVFIHRYLLEHFAEIAVERGYVDVNARRHPQSF